VTAQLLLALRWYAVVQAFGLAALPLCQRLFRHLPDRGYGVSKPLGLLLAGWAFWLLTTFGWMHNTAGDVVAILGLLAAVGLLLAARARTTSGTSSNPVWGLRGCWRVVLATELLFALTFAAWCLVRAHMPRIQTAGGEKWMEIAFLRAILRSDRFPPHDPWLSGFAISYYYFGYVIVAMITRLAAVPASIAFNLGVATLFALVCTGAFSLVYNLIAVGRASIGCPSAPSHSHTPTPSHAHTLTALLSGLLGPLLVAVVGNLEGFLEVLHARGVGRAGFWAWLDVRGIDGPPPPFAQGSWAPTRFFWWWQASRVLQDYTPWGDEQHVIDEFPAFSFILGDMHPHVLALPFALLALALALNLYLRLVNEQNEQRGEQGAIRSSRAPLSFLRALGPVPFAGWEFMVYALCLGGLGFLNTWDFPIYLFVVGAAYALAHLYPTSHATRTTPHAPRNTHHVTRIALCVVRVAVPLLLAGVLLYLPFWLGFQSQAGGVLPNLFNATRLPQFLVMFGPLVPLVVFFAVEQARRSGVNARHVARWTLTAALAVLGLSILIVGLLVMLVWLGAIPSQGPARYLVAWLRGGPIPGLESVPDAPALVSRGLLSRLLNPWTALGLIALLTTVVLVFLPPRVREGRLRPPRLHPPTSKGSEAAQSYAKGSEAAQSPIPTSRFVLLLVGTGALLTLSVEYVYLRDHFGTRMNTVFKFYFQAWVMWAVAGAYALADCLRRAATRGRLVALGLLALPILAGLVYPALAIPARAREYDGSGHTPLTLDGTAYLAQVYPDDYDAIAWLNQNVDGAPVILEAPGDRFQAYVYEGRVSAHTGLPTLLGWAGHEHQWRGDYDEQARREPDIETLYTSVDRDEVLTLLQEYDIQYVYVGPIERARYSPTGLAKFAGLLDVVYEVGAVKIYRERE